MKLIKNIADRLSIFEKFYDDIRILGPIKNNKDFDKAILNEENCKEYVFRQKTTMSCTNCAAAKAYCSNDTIIRYNYSNGKPASIIATPVNIDGEMYIVEIIKILSHDELLTIGLPEENVQKKITELNYKVLHDDLTNVYNRRYIDDKLQKVITSSCDNGKILSIIMCDIDYFKCINDTYGHLCGDEMLKCFASIIDEKAAQESGWTGSYGGEEFICLIPDKNADETYKIAESMRLEFEKAFITFEGKKIKTTASFGIASLSPKVEMSSKNLIKIADTRLYIAKEKGRNLVIK